MEFLLGISIIISFTVCMALVFSEDAVKIIRAIKEY